MNEIKVTNPLTNQATTLLSTIFLSLKSLSLPSELFTQLQSNYTHLVPELSTQLDALLTLPEALPPKLFINGLRLVNLPENQTLLINFIKRKVLIIDEVLGWTNLCKDWFDLAINQLDLNGLENTREQYHRYIVIKSQFFVNQTVSNLTLLPLVDFFDLDLVQTSQYLYKLTNLGLNPTILFSFIKSNFQQLNQKYSDWYLLLDLPPNNLKNDIDSSQYSRVWDSSIELDFIKTCLLYLSSSENNLNSEKISAIMNLVTLYSSYSFSLEIKGLIYLDLFTPTYILNIDQFDQVLPILNFLFNQLDGWEWMEEYDYYLPTLKSKVTQIIGATPNNQNLVLIQFLRKALDKIHSLDDTMSFWSTLKKLQLKGYYRSLTEKDLFSKLVENLLYLEKYEVLDHLTRQQQLPLSLQEFSELSIDASKEIYDNIIDSTDPHGLNGSLLCLEVVEPDGEVILWRDTILATQKLLNLYTKSNISPLPLPIQIRLDPAQRLAELLAHPKSTLYKQLGQIQELCNLFELDAIIQSDLRATMIRQTIKRGDYVQGYLLATKLMGDELTLNEMEACFELATQPEFKDVDKRQSLISLGLSIAPPQNLYKWLSYYRQLEATTSLPNLFIPAKHEQLSFLFHPEPIDEPKPLPDITDILLGSTNKPKSHPLQEHPLYDIEVSGKGGEYYDGSSWPTQQEVALRFINLIADSRNDLSLLQSEEVYKLVHQIAYIPNSAMSQFYLLHFTQDEAVEFFKTLPMTSKNAIWASYHFGLNYLSLTYYKQHQNLANFEPMPNLTLIPPESILQFVQNCSNKPKGSIEDEDEACKKALDLAIAYFNDANQKSSDYQLFEHLEAIDADFDGFTNSPATDQAYLLQSRASTSDQQQILNVLAIASSIDLPAKPLVVAFFKHYFCEGEGLADSISTFENIIKPVINEHLNDGEVRSEVQAVYGVIDGKDWFRCLALLKLYEEKLSNGIPDEKSKVLLNQVKLRILLLDILIPIREDTCFKANQNIKEYFLLLQQRSIDPLKPVLLALIDHFGVDMILERCDELAQFEPILDEVKPNSKTKKDGLEFVQKLKSNICFWYLTDTINKVIDDNGMVLPDNIDPLSEYFSHLNSGQSLQLCQKFCGPDQAQYMPLLTCRVVVQLVTENAPSEPHKKKSFESLFRPIQQRVDLLECLTDITDPLTGEDLGYSLIQQIDTMNKESTKAVDGLITQLLSDQVSLWLVFQAAVILYQYHPAGLRNWKDHFESSSSTSLFLADFVITLFKRSKAKEDSIQLIQILSSNLGPYIASKSDHPWAEQCFEQIQSYLLDKVVPNFELSGIVRQRAISILNDYFLSDDFDAIETLLQWKCICLFEMCFDQKLKLKDFLGDFEDEKEVIKLMLSSIPTTPEMKLGCLTQCMSIFTQYYLVSSATQSISSELSELWFDVLDTMVSEVGLDGEYLFKVWEYITPSLDLYVMQSREHDFLTKLQPFHPTTYFQIGLSSRDPLIFDRVQQELFTLDVYELDLDQDQVIFLTLVLKDEAYQLALALPKHFQHDLEQMILSHYNKSLLVCKTIRNLMDPPHIVNYDSIQRLANLAENLLKRAEPGFLPQMLKGFMAKNMGIDLSNKNKLNDYLLRDLPTKPVFLESDLPLTFSNDIPKLQDLRDQFKFTEPISNDNDEIITGFNILDQFDFYIKVINLNIDRFY